MRCIAVLAIAMATSWAAPAQQIYKCANGVYSQTPCANNAAPKAVIKYTPEPDHPTQYYSAPSEQSYRFSQAQPQTRWAQGQSSMGAAISTGNGRSAADEIAALANDPRFKGNRTLRQAAANAILQSHGMNGVSYPSAPQTDSSYGIGQPTRVIDQRTGMPINGAIKVAPNRIWDPATGRYYDTN